MAKPRRYGNPHKLTKEQDQEIARLHLEGMRIKDLCILFGGVHPGVIRMALKYEGVPVNPFRRHIKIDAFDNLHEEHACYWLGFIYADGFVSKDLYPQFSVKLKYADKEHLEKLRNFLEIDIPLTVSKTSSKSIWYNQISLRSSNKMFNEKLRSLGILVGRPLPYLAIQNIPEPMLHHFFRGIFDGDGCAQKIPAFVFLSQKEILDVLRNELIEHAGVSSVRTPKQNGKIFRLDYGGFQQAMKIKKYLYHNATVFMDRKFEVINSWTRQTRTFLGTR